MTFAGQQAVCPIRSADPTEPADATIRLAVWSGPRNISTALMRSWENRPDAIVVDEPLYAYYLARTGIDHPMREEVLQSQPTDMATIVAALFAPVPDGVAVFYQKHMAHHLLDDTERSWIPRLRNVLLIRDPLEVVVSYQQARAAVVAADLGVDRQLELWTELAATGPAPPIVDAGDFLADPEAHLRWLCEWAGVPFDRRMLAWPAGPRDSDGVWAQHWYAAVWSSTGFERRPARTVDLDVDSAAVVAEVRPMYEHLWARRVQV